MVTNSSSSKCEKGNVTMAFSELDEIEMVEILVTLPVGMTKDVRALHPAMVKLVILLRALPPTTIVCKLLN